MFQKVAGSAGRSRCFCDNVGAQGLPVRNHVNHDVGVDLAGDVVVDIDGDGDLDMTAQGTDQSGHLSRNRLSVPTRFTSPSPSTSTTKSTPTSTRRVRFRERALTTAA